MNKKTILITGVAGFIGSNLTTTLLSKYDDATIIGIDNMNEYYDVELKRHRLSLLHEKASESGCVFEFREQDIGEAEEMHRLFQHFRPNIVVNLAAQAGVRYSIDHPEEYIRSNIVGFFHIMEACRRYEVEHLVFASSSSVYGGNTKYPFSEEDPVDQPVSLYAASKKSDELLAYSYAKLYGIPMTGLRFFTVYGPAGRPDMAYYKFAEILKNGGKIQIYNYGNCKRDFTYVDDVVDGILAVMKTPPKGVEPPYRIYNIGNSSPENLMDFVQILSEELQRCGVLPKDFNMKEHQKLVPMQPGDVPVTFADTTRLERDFGFAPKTPLRQGLRKFAEWYADFDRTKTI